MTRIVVDVISGKANVDENFIAPSYEVEVSPHRDLTRSEFKGLLAASGYDAVWGGLEAALKGVTTPEAKAGRRALAIHRAQDTFNLDATLALVGEFGPQIDVLFPDVKISAEDIISEWEETVGDAV